MKINGNLELVQDAGNVGVSFIKNAIIERLASAPTGITGRLYYDTGINAYFYYDGTAWVQFAAGTTSVSSFSAGTTGLTPATDTTGAITLGGTLNVGHGGTGATTLTNHGVLLGQGTSAVVATSVGASGTVLKGNTGADPSFGAVDLTTDVTGVLPPANGGTGVANANTITLGGDLTTGGAFTTTPANDVTLTTTGATNVTLPTSGTLLTSADAVTSITGTANEITASASTGDVTLSLPSALVAPGSVEVTTSLTVDGLTANTALIANGSKVITSVGLNDGQFVIGATGGAPAAGTITAGNAGITVTPGTNTISVSNAGVLSFAVSTTSAGVTVTPTGATTGAISATVDINAQLQALGAIDGSASQGFIVETGANTVALRSISGTANNIVVTNGDGVAASPTINLAAVTQGTTGTSFVKVALDGFGRVTNNTAVTTSDITALVDSTYVNVTGDTMTGNLTMSSGATVTGLPDPTNDADAASKAYVDAKVTGLTWKDAVVAISTTNLAATYTAPVLTASANGALVVDGHSMANGDRLLVAGQTVGTNNGIYVVTDAGSAGTPFVLTRAADMAVGSDADGAAVFVKFGTTFANSGWVETADPAVVDTDALTFAEFSGGAVYVGGTGIDITGNTITAKLGAGIAELPTGDIGVDLFNPTTGALILTDDGSTRSTDAASQLYLLLASAGGLTQDATGLYIPASAVTNAMLVNSTVTLDVSGGGTSDIALGGTLTIVGDAAQGVSTDVSGTSGSAPTITITVADAGLTSSNKGVAWFDPAFFTASSGEVSLSSSANLTVASLTDTGLTAHGVVYADASKTLQSVALTNGQILIGSTGADPVAATITGTANQIGVTNAAGSITLTNLGVLSFSAGTTGLTPNTGTTGDVVLAGTLVAANGGTGQSSYTTGDILYASGTTALSKLAFGAANTVLRTGSGTIPSWGKVDLTADVTGTLPVANGGTNLTTVGAAGTVLHSTGSALSYTPIEFVFAAVSAKKAFLVNHNLGQQNVQVVVYDQTAAASFAVTAVSTGSGTFTISGDHSAVFVAGVQFAVVGSTGNDQTYTVVSSAFGGVNTVITVEETVADSTADGTIYVGPSQIIPQQVMQVDANNTIVTFNVAIQPTVVITGIAGA